VTAADPLALSVMFPSNFLKAEDLQGRAITVTIQSVAGEQVPMTGGKKEKCNVVRLVGKKKQWILNRTNANALALLLSPDPRQPSARDWFGKRVSLVEDIDTKSGEELVSIRIAGSPDAAPDRAAAYERAWRGERKGGKLCARLKRARALLAVARVEEMAPSGEGMLPERSTEPEPAEEAPDDFGAEEEQSDTNGGGA
jgi:hypothetical protein